ncbi:MAG: LptF/LptG family permease [Kiritimatiellae bacterium]|jgi:lipopolysaccharide export system permease protein|nr:LptF/LptG family permease [Kiritimatiellia bacterium]NLD90039.1 YjgP/YjgQ family permease [Lentisphaerota bacterium]HOU21731.1 LptF/LptG family permease [Kiritimatiellia bacterium]HPC20254.1 LptF/LptG family permease [Kiritimatiellia bacterium]
MKLVTRYLLSHMRRPWLYVIAGFCLIAVLVDLFANFVDFMEAEIRMQEVLLYYAILLPTYLPYLLPVSLLLALLYALWQLGKNSELVAMRACGLSLAQLMMPYLVTGLLASVLLLGINELFNPGATYWTRQFKRQQGIGRGTPAGLTENLAYKNVRGRRIWRVNSFDPRPDSGFEMRDINLTQQRPDGSDEFRMDAERGRWLGSHWWFERVEIRYFNPNNDPLGPPESYANLDMTMLSEGPGDFVNEIKEANERSARDIRRFLTLHEGISMETRNRLMVDYHYRLASPWLCFIVILVGVPFGTHSGRRGMGMGILWALLTFFGYYILMGLGLAYGKRQLLSPVLAGWGPGLVFFILGIALTRRLR